MSKRTNDRNLDVVLVFLGTNDYNMGVPIGEWYTEETTQVEASTGEMKQFYTRQHRQFVMSEDTYCGRINLGITKIRQQYPQATIVLLTPLHRALFDAGDHNLQPDELYHNKCGEFLDAYVDKIKEAAGIWSVYVIDLQSVSGIMPLMEEHSIYMSGEKDKLHPSATGHERLAKVLLYQTFSMP
jgi:lysophospholipase L1-like esterase